MKKAGLVGGGMLLAVAAGYGQGTVDFRNAGAPVSNILTMARVPAGNTFWVSLHWLPDSPEAPTSEDFDAAGPVAVAATTNFFAPGYFYGGTVRIEGIDPPGGWAWFQVRVWEHLYGGREINSFAEAQNTALDPFLLRPILRGTSNIFRVDTGDPTRSPPDPPAALTGPGKLQSFYVTHENVDIEPPTIRCPPDLVLATDPGQESRSNVTWTVEVTDNCPLVAVSCVPASGATFPTGVTAVTCVARDVALNSNTCAFTVTVIRVPSRQVRLRGGEALPGQMVEAAVELVGYGIENAATFSIQFDPALLRYRSAALGPDLSGAAELVLNTNEVAVGRLGASVSLPLGQPIDPGTNQVLALSFEAVNVARPTNIVVGFSDQPAARQVMSANLEVLETDWVPGTITLRPWIWFEPPRRAGGQIECVLEARTGTNIVIQVSTNLEQWSDWSTVPVPNGTAAFTVPVTPGSRFYRAQSQP